MAGAATGVLDAFRRAVEALEEVGAAFCLVGGLARAFLAEARTTKDVDFAISAGSEAAVDELVRSLQSRGLVVREVFQHKDGRVATVRMTWGSSPIRIDLLFATSGLEPLVVRDAVVREVLPGATAPVILLPHLVAMKLVAGRDQDLIDVGALLEVATAADRRRVPSLLAHLEPGRRARALQLWKTFSSRAPAGEVLFAVRGRRRSKAPARPKPRR